MLPAIQQLLHAFTNAKVSTALGLVVLFGAALFLDHARVISISTIYAGANAIVWFLLLAAIVFFFVRAFQEGVIAWREHDRQRLIFSHIEANAMRKAHSPELPVPAVPSYMLGLHAVCTTKHGSAKLMSARLRAPAHQVATRPAMTATDKWTGKVEVEPHITGGQTWLIMIGCDVTPKRAFPFGGRIKMKFDLIDDNNRRHPVTAIAQIIG